MFTAVCMPGRAMVRDYHEERRNDRERQEALLSQGVTDAAALEPREPVPQRRVVVARAALAAQEGEPGLQPAALPARFGVVETGVRRVVQATPMAVPPTGGATGAPPTELELMAQSAAAARELAAVV